MKYFHTCRTLDEVKAMYKQLAKEHHPDVGGDTATMQAINVEYACACARILKEANLSPEESGEGIRLTEQYRVVIEALMAFAGIVIEVVGDWVWVTGSTYSIRKELKAIGMFYAPKKVAWYYRSEEHSTTGSKKTLDEIRAKYGSETVSSRHNSKAIKQTS